MRFPTGLRALHHRDFRLFFSGQLISLIGTWMQSVAQSWLVLELTNSPFKLGLISALQSAPMLCLAFVAGAIADRFPKRHILIGTQTALMGQAFVLAVLVLSLVGLAQMVFVAACNTTLQLAVPDRMRGRIMSLYAFLFVGFTPLGSLFVGTAAHWFGVAVAYGLAGGLALASILGLGLLGRRGWAASADAAAEPPTAA